jgi:translation initiation factor 2 beta subunit (eIF-2beta)/eIF-5
MRIIADIPKSALIMGEKRYAISNLVRSVREGTRQSSEVVHTIPDNLPYDPMPFPKGVWQVTGIEWQKEKGFDPRTYGPVKIRTNARQRVRVWELDEEGDYRRERGDEVMDHGYLLHYSVSNTTLGCIRFASPYDAETIAEHIQSVMDGGETVEMEVL